MNRKKIIVIVGIIILILLGVGLYFYFSKKAPGPGDVGKFPGDGTPVGGDTIVPPPDTEEPFIPGLGTSLPRLYELHNTPVAGVGFAEKTVAKQKLFFARFIERGVGHILETDLSTLLKNKISSETHISVAEALFANKGRSLIIRFVEEQDARAIKTRTLVLGEPTITIPSDTPTQEGAIVPPPPEEVSLPDHIPFMATAGDGSDKIFYLENSPISARGSVATSRAVKPTAIFTSSFTEWIPDFPNQNLVTLTTRPSEKIPGHLFFLNTKDQVLNKVLDGINGLTTLTSRDGKLVLYSTTGNGMPNLFVYDVAKRSSRELLVRTLPEKCAWSTKNVTMIYCAIPYDFPPAKYPDQWYQGTVELSDSVWKINAKTGDTEKVFAPNVFKAPEMDIVTPVVSSDDSYLLFINKKTSTPWVYRLTEDQIVNPRTATPEVTTPASTTNGPSAKINTRTRAQNQAASLEGMQKIR